MHGFKQNTLSSFEGKVKVSVVVPAYNVAPYIGDSLRSVTSQTLKEIEIIVVNDGSTDSTLEIVNAQAALDERIEVVSIQNQGLSVARNVGFYKATGKYVYFFDSDDLLEKDALELCFNKCEADKLDFVFFDAETFCDDGKLEAIKEKFDYHRAYLYDDVTYSGTDILRKQLDTNGYKSQTCLSLISKKFLSDTRLWFFPYIIHEDELFTYLLYLRAKRVGVIGRAFFHRRLRNNSIMTTRYGMRNAVGCMTVCRELKKYASEYGRTSEERRLVKGKIRGMISGILSSADNYLEKPERDYIRKVISYEFFNYLTAKGVLKLKFPSLYDCLKKLCSQGGVKCKFISLYAVEPVYNLNTWNYARA